MFTSHKGGAYVASSSVHAAERATSGKRQSATADKRDACKQRDAVRKGTALVEPAHAGKAAQKRLADDCEQTAEELLQTKAALLRNLTTLRLTNADLSTAKDWHCQGRSRPAGTASRTGKVK